MAIFLAGCGGGGGTGTGSTGPGSGSGGGGSTPATCVTPNTPAPRTTFSFTGGLPTNLIFDSARQLIWTTNTVLNEVDVLNLAGSVQARIPVPEPVGIDITADGSAIVIGTYTQYLYVADPAKLRIVEQVAVPLGTSPPGNPLVPALVLTAANGKVLIFAEDGSVVGQALGESAVLEWDPVAGTFTDRTADAQRPGIVARSADHSLIAMGNAESPGHLVAYYSATDSFAISSDDLDTNFMDGLAVNSHGTQIAAWTPGGLELFDGKLNLQNTIGSPAVLPLTILGQSYGGALFSPDDSQLYGSITVGDVVQAPFGFAIMNVNSNSTVEVPYGHDGIPSAIASNGLVLTTGIGGVGFVDPTRAPVPTTVDLQPAFPNLTPGNGSVDQVNFDHFSQKVSVYVGDQPACNTGSSINVPASTSPGPVNVTGVSPTGWVVVAPNAYSYGPSLRQLSPNGAPMAGGTTVDIFGYGLNYSASAIAVRIGGQPAQVVSSAYSNQGDESGIDDLRVVLPAGIPGWADVVVTTPDGTDTLHQGLYYTGSQNFYAGPQGMTQLVMDPSHQKLYGLAPGSIAVFDTASSTYLAPLPLPGISSGALLTGMALTPDGATLAVADNTDREILLLDPNTPGSVAAVPMPSQAGCVMAPGNMAATNQGSLMVITNCDEVEQLNLTTRTFSPAFQTVYQGTFAATPDGSSIFGAGGLWTAASGKFVAEPFFSLLSGQSNVAITDDGTQLEVDGQASPRFARTDFSLIGQALLPDYVPGDLIMTGGRFDATGALFFLPLPDGLDVFDSMHGRFEMRIPVPRANTGGMAFDEQANTLYLLTQSGIQSIPLSGGFPLALRGAQLSGPFTAGGTLTLHGTGFTSGTSVQLNGGTVSTAYIDSNTVRIVLPPLPPGPVQITVRNLDGQTYRWDAAFTMP